MEDEEEDEVNTREERKRREMLAVEIDMFCQQLLPGKKLKKPCVCVVERESG